MISVIIPLYNKEQQIEETLKSVLDQSFERFEIVIVDDGSTDTSVEKALMFRDPRIRLIRQENAGVSAARNRGVAEAHFDFVAFLDADDRWKPNYLQTQYELSQKYPQCDVFACNYEFVHLDGSVHPTIIRKLKITGQDGILDNYFEVASCSHPPLWTSAVMVRKAALQQIGGFPIGVKWGEDLLVWVKLAISGSIAYTKNIMAGYCFSPTTNKKSLPLDIQEIPDKVAIELINIKKHISKQKNSFFDSYISFWFKMRAHINLIWGNRFTALKLSLYSIKYNKINLKAWRILLISLCVPNFILKKNKIS